MRQVLADAINRMPDRERLVLTLYYYEGLTLAEIGNVLGVTESRVCQIHTKAIFQLRSRLSRAPPRTRPRHLTSAFAAGEPVVAPDPSAALRLRPCASAHFAGGFPDRRPYGRGRSLPCGRVACAGPGSSASCVGRGRPRCRRRGRGGCAGDGPWSAPVDGPVVRGFDPPATRFGRGPSRRRLRRRRPARRCGPPARGPSCSRAGSGRPVHVVVLPRRRAPHSYSFLATIAVRPARRSAGATSLGHDRRHGARTTRRVLHFGPARRRHLRRPDAALRARRTSRSIVHLAPRSAGAPAAAGAAATAAGPSGVSAWPPAGAPVAEPVGAWPRTGPRDAALPPRLCMPRLGSRTAVRPGAAPDRGTGAARMGRERRPLH